MKQIRKRLTYANVMSSLAVFMVLGGGAAVAANNLPNKSVGPKQLKANAVTTPKIKSNAVTMKKVKKNAITTPKLRNGAVTTAKIKDGAVTGSKINLASLGTVPSAANANSASSLAGRTVFSFYAPAGLHDVATVGPFTIKASCTINDGGTDRAELQLFTSEEKSAMDDNSGDEWASFGPADSPVEMIAESESTTEPDIEAGYGFIAVAPNGTAIATDNHAVAVNVAGRVGQCYFSGILETLG